MEKSNPYLKGSTSLKRPREGGGVEGEGRVVDVLDPPRNNSNSNRNENEVILPTDRRGPSQPHSLNHPSIPWTTATTTATTTTTETQHPPSLPLPLPRQLRNPYVKESRTILPARRNTSGDPNNHHDNDDSGRGGHVPSNPIVPPPPTTTATTTTTTRTAIHPLASCRPASGEDLSDDDEVVVVVTTPPTSSRPTPLIPRVVRPGVWIKDTTTTTTATTAKTSALAPATKTTLVAAGGGGGSGGMMRPTMNSTLLPSRTTATSRPPPQSQQQQQSQQPRPELDGEALLPPELVYDPNILLQPIKDDYRSLLTLNARLNEPLLNGWTLFGHQKRAILKGLMKRRLILALDMGLGKTLIGCVWARAFQQSYDRLKVFVICPTTLVTEWKRTAETVTGLTVEQPPQDMKKNPKKNQNNKTTTTIDSSLFDVHVSTWQKIPSVVDPRVQHYVVVFDEAHMMQSMESNRTQAALEFVTRDARCVGTLLLTGTPMKNGKPSNMFPLLKAVKHPLGANQRAFEKHFCEGHLRSFGAGASTWVANGQANLKQLHRMIEPKLLYMTKDEYLKELPPMSQETRSVPVSPSYQQQYMRTIKVLANLKEAMKTNKNLTSESLLGALSDVRIVCALAKVSATVEIAKEVLEVEPSIVIFATYQACVRQIAQNLTDCGHAVAAITGQTNPKERQVLVDGFQVGAMLLT